MHASTFDLQLNVQKTRGLNESGLEKTIIPYRYYKSSQLYSPSGFSYDSGILHIQELPPPTSGFICEVG